MAEIQVHAERTIDAPAERVYAAIADLTNRSTWVPAAYSNVHLERREEEQGTVLDYHLETGRRARDYRMDVTEPEPGHTLRERDTTSSLVKTWTVQADGSGSRVSINTRWSGASGIGGFFERTFAPRALTQLYGEELDALAAYVSET